MKNGRKKNKKNFFDGKMLFAIDPCWKNEENYKFFLELTEAIELVSTLLCIRLEIIHEN